MTAEAIPAAQAAPQNAVSGDNWPEYDRALVRRGRLTIGFDEEFLREHGWPAPPGRRGAPF